MSTTLDHFYQEYLPAIEDEMQIVLASNEVAYDHYYGMMRYHLGWLDAQLDPLDSKAGKRIRPLVLLLACNSSGGNWEQALPAAAAIELLHNFSLIHDDIEDDSDTRRGRTTVWKLWGIPQAINAGDSMFASAFDALGRLAERKVPADAVVTAHKIFTDACIKLTKGQHLDMWFESQGDVKVDDYLEMISGKTAALLVATTQIGALVAGTDANTQNYFGEFGRNVGLAFQAYDDILGVWGDEALLGKSTASDILTRKKTMPVLYGLNQSAELRQLYAQTEIDLEKAVNLLNKVGAREYTQAAAQRYSDIAIKNLDAADPQGSAGEALRTLTAQLIQRES